MIGKTVEQYNPHPTDVAYNITAGHLVCCVTVDIDDIVVHVDHNAWAGGKFMHKPFSAMRRWLDKNVAGAKVVRVDKVDV